MWYLKQELGSIWEYRNYKGDDWKQKWTRRYPEQTWYSIDLDDLDKVNFSERVERKFILHDYVYETHWDIIPGQENKFYREADFWVFVETNLQREKEGFLEFISDFKAVCQALADEPIKDDSGLEQPRKRKQINSDTSPRNAHPSAKSNHASSATLSGCEK